MNALSSDSIVAFPPCVHRLDGSRCAIAERIADSVRRVDFIESSVIECRATVEQCRKCLSLETPGDVNAMTVGVACLSLIQGGFRRSAGCVAQCYHAFIPKAQRPDSPPDGAGTELERIIATWFGISDDPKCKCKSRVAEMNARGVAWCETNIETIVAWLKEEAARRQLFFSKPVARQVVRLAIRRAKAKSKKPGWNGVP